MAYFPELYGVYAVAALIDILDGRAVPQEIHIDHVWVNRDNVDQYYDPEGQPIHSLGPAHRRVVRRMRRVVRLR